MPGYAIALSHLSFSKKRVSADGRQRAFETAPPSNKVTGETLGGASQETGPIIVSSKRQAEREKQ
jgi:hypothetical protein